MDVSKYVQAQIGFWHNGFDSSYDNSFQLVFLQLVPTLCAKLLFEPKIVPWLFLWWNKNGDLFFLSGFYSLWLHKEYKILKVVEVVLFKCAWLETPH